MDETKIIYHIDEEETPYLIKIPLPADKVTLGDFKNALNRPNYKFFFKSMDDDFGVVKEEIIEDETRLPCFNGRVVSWLVTTDGSNQSDTRSHSTENNSDKPSVLPNDIRSQTSFNASQVAAVRDGVDNDSCDTYTDTDSVYSARQDGIAPLRNFHDYKQHGKVGSRGNNSKVYSSRLPPTYESASSMMSSDLESTSFFDSEDESSRFSTTTGTTMSSKYGRQRRQRRCRRRMPPISHASSFSSMTDSSMSLNVITVTLNMDMVNFLGISIVGQSNKGGDGGIYVGSIMQGGAVAADGRIEPGDMILEVNGIDFQNMNNDEAVRLLREQVQKPGPVTLVVAKCWDQGTKGYLTVPRGEPVRPIDPRAWIMHTNAMTQGDFLRAHTGGVAGGGGGAPSVTTMTSTSSSMASSLPESDRYIDEVRLSVDSDMLSVVRIMAQSDSGLEIRDRMWLKITIPNAFIGSDLVDWLYNHVDGFADRRDARKYACNLLKAGFIRHTVNKVTFSEQCYYIFGDLSSVMSSLSLEEVDSISESLDRDTLAPLPPPTWSNHSSSQVSSPPPPYPMSNYNGPAPSFSYAEASPFNSLPPVSLGTASMGQVKPAPSVLSGSGTVGGKCGCVQTSFIKSAVKTLWQDKDKLLEFQQKASAAKIAEVKQYPQPPVTNSPLHHAVNGSPALPPRQRPAAGPLNQLTSSMIGRKPCMLSDSHSSDDTGSSGSERSRRSAGLHKTPPGLPPGLPCNIMNGPPGLPPQHMQSYGSNGGQLLQQSGMGAMPVSVPMVPVTALGMEHPGVPKSHMLPPSYGPDSVPLTNYSDDLKFSKQSFRMA